MTITDLITCFLSIFFLFRGSSRGFMRSLTGPFSIIVTSIISIIYYQNTKDMVTSLLIGLIGPLLLNFLLKFLLKSWAKATNTDIKPTFISSLGGAFLTLVWGWVFIAFTLILLAVLPPWAEALKPLHDDVTRSISYSMVRPWQETLFASSKQSLSDAAPAGSDAKSLADDPRFQQVLQDPEIQEEINAHNIVKLMSNPKMMELTKEIMSDPATMKKVMTIYSSQAQPQEKTPN